MGVWGQDGDRGRLGLGTEDSVRRGGFESNEIVVMISDNNEADL